MTEIKQILIPLALFIFISIVAIIGLVLLFKYLNKRLTLHTALKILNNNEHKLDRSLIDSLIKEKPNKNFDLRIGTLCLVTSLTFFVIGFFMNSHGYFIAQLSLYGMGLFPGLIGLTLLGFHFLKIKNN